jgi:stringent starvation protein B
MADLPRPLPPKKDVALALLEGPSVFVHLDPRRSGVSVPKWFLGQPQLVLQVGLNMAIPIPDLKVDDDGVSCTLSFSRTPFWCCIPWSAVYALVGEDGRGMVWPNDVPPELVSQMQQKMSPGAAAPQKQARKQRAKLAAVDPASSGGSGGSEAAESVRPRSRAKPEASRDESPEAPAEIPTRLRPEPLRPSEKSPRAPEARPAPSPLQRREAEATPPAKAPTPKPSPAAPAGQKKPKRELPPYLRVIK